MPCLAIMLAAAAFAQTTAEKALPIQTSVCEISNSPERFQGQFVTVRGRYDSNWEWGAWIGADHCDKALTFVLANGFSTPSYLSNLYVRKNEAFDLFQKQTRLLCNGMSLLCDFDYVEADFTGVVVGPREIREWRGPQQNDTVLVVTAITAPQLHRDEHPMGTQTPPLPSTIPESAQFPTQSNPTFYIAKPTILAFFVPLSQTQPKEDAADSNEALADFQFYGRQVLKSFAKIGVDYKEVYASGFVVRLADATTMFRPAKGVGYYFVAPNKKPRVEYGVMTDRDLLHAARNYFGMNDKQQ